MIGYRDFVPSRVEGGFLRSDRFAPFADAVAEANAWIQQESVEVITVETVVLPNIFEANEEGSGDAHLRTPEADTVSNAWHQFVRVWYRADGATAR